jgi:Kef-type K+ transport system membrane component KefB
MDPKNLVAVVLALQFAAFGWRIARELKLEEEQRKTWLLAEDYLNFVTMLGIVVFCIVFPLATAEFGPVSRAFLAASAVFIVFYPIILAGHYRLFSKLGRTIYSDRDDYPWVTDQEAVLLVVALIGAGFAAFFVVR